MGVAKRSPIQQEYYVTGYSFEPFKQDRSIWTISGHFSKYKTACTERECPFLGNWFISNIEEYWRVVRVSFRPDTYSILNSDGIRISTCCSHSSTA